MASRAIKQPNGLYARFSDVVDDFTDINCSREELHIVFRDEGGISSADRKLKDADENPQRFEEEMESIREIHGDTVADERLKKMSVMTGQVHTEV
jgi:hypothetical protein